MSQDEYPQPGTLVRVEGPQVGDHVTVTLRGHVVAETVHESGHRLVRVELNPAQVLQHHGEPLAVWEVAELVQIVAPADVPDGTPVSTAAPAWPDA